MPTIFRFFWFICAAVMAVNLVVWRGRFAAIVDRGVVTLVSGVGASIAWRQMPVPSNIACPPIAAVLQTE